MNGKVTLLRAANKARSMQYNIYGSLRKRAPILRVPPTLIDSALKTRNAGDAIIMHFVNKQLSELWPEYDFYRVPKHGFAYTIDTEYENTVKILCGTNALATDSDYDCSFALSYNPRQYYQSVLLLAVGMAHFDRLSTFNSSTRRLLKTILTPNMLHSVRDSNTVKHLNAAGIQNVVNTSCVTMWDLTQDFCQTIPTEKSVDVLTTITDYDFDPRQDQYMLTTLSGEYKNVYLWLQGSQDLAKASSLDLKPNVHFINDGFSGLERFVKEHDDIDYFGTRLHCGIYCLNHGIRSMVVEVDNRARDIALDTNLPTVHRSNLQEQMVSLIREARKTSIVLPTENIRLWKEQFK